MSDNLEILVKANAQLQQCQTLGQSTLTELDRQKAVIHKDTHRITEINTELKQSSSLIEKMRQFWRG